MDVVSPEILLRYSLFLGGVVALILLLAWLVKKIGGLGPALGGRGKRIGVVEAAAVDARRRLVLVRRDDREHLVMTGPMGDLVIESGIPAPRATEREGAP